MHGWTGSADQTAQYMLIDLKYDPNVKHRSVLYEPFAPIDSCWDNKGFSTGTHMDDPQPSRQLSIVFEMIPYILKELNLDSSRCYVNGGSNGGYATWDMILYRPELFACAIPIAGAGDPRKATGIAHLPLRVYHGASDNIVPVTGSRDMVQAIRRLGGDPYCMEYTTGHDAWTPAFEDTALLTWMFSKVKIPDATAPSIPANVSGAGLAGGNKISLTWTASVDAQSGSVFYYVYRNGVRVAEVTTPSYTDSLLAEQTAYGYRVSAFNPCDKESPKSDSITVQTLSDTKAPAIIWVRTPTPRAVSVRFSEKVIKAVAENPANYALSGGISIAAATLQADTVTVRLALSSALALATNYALTVNNVTDLARNAPNTIAGNTGATFRYVPIGFVFQESWLSVSGGSVPELTGSAAFAGTPSRIDTIKTSEIRRLFQANWGCRIKGYLYPPFTGAYTFWISSDDASQLFISTDSSDTHKRMVARIDANTPYRIYDLPSYQRTPLLPLTKDTKYYFEVLFKQASGDEHCSVVWKTPADPWARTVIPGDYLVPFGVAQTATAPGARTSSQTAPWTIMRSGPALSVRSSGIHRVMIYDLRGSLRAGFSGTGNREIDLSACGLRNGLYPVLIKAGNKAVTIPLTIIAPQ